MSTIKVSELFYSTQGEGRYMGVPSVFLRVYGCNFHCASFGMPAGQRSTEPDEIDPTQFNSYDELPIVKTGCDSYPSWHPNFKQFSPLRDTNDIAEDIVQLLPHKSWIDEHMVFTGGEPLLGWQRSYPALLDHPRMRELKEITFETNGTQEISLTFGKYLSSWREKPGREITFSVSPKLSCSGEPRELAIKPSVVVSYQDYGYVYLKFVVSTESDAQEALEVIELYRAAGFTGPVYLMPLGGVEEVYNLNNRAVAELALKHGLRYSDRLHLPLFGNAWST